MHRQAQSNFSGNFQQGCTEPKLDRLIPNEDELLQLLRALNKHKSAEPTGIYLATVYRSGDVISKPVTEPHRESTRLDGIPVG